MLLLDFMLAVPAITLLLYIPLVCWLDWKYREVEHSWWIGLLLINGPLMVTLILAGVYEWWMLVISLVAIVWYFAAMKLHYIEGADFMYCMWISLFLVYNPISGHWLMALPFSIFLTTTLIITGVVVMWWNFINNRGMTFTFPRGVPLMLPISAALVLTVMLV